MEERTKEVERDIQRQMAQSIPNNDLISSYIFFRNFVPNNSIEAYIAVKKCVEIGKDLLPTDMNGKEQEEINVVYENACKKLISAKPDRRKISLEFKDFGEGRIPIYTISSNDAHPCNAEKDLLDKILQNFVEQQFQNHIHELQDSDNEILHILVEKKIYEKKKLRFDEELEDMLAKGVHEKANKKKVK